MLAGDWGVTMQLLQLWAVGGSWEAVRPCAAGTCKGVGRGVRAGIFPGGHGAVGRKGQGMPTEKEQEDSECLPIRGKPG